MAPKLWSKGAEVAVHGVIACRISSDQGSNPCLLHWQPGSLPLSHQGSPVFFSFAKPLERKLKLLERKACCPFTLKCFCEHFLAMGTSVYPTTVHLPNAHLIKSVISLGLFFLLAVLGLCCRALVSLIASLVVALKACRILAPRPLCPALEGIEPLFPALEGRFLAADSPERPYLESSSPSCRFSQSSSAAFVFPVQVHPLVVVVLLSPLFWC